MNWFAIALLLLYLAQDIFGWKWEYLQTLQGQPDYKIWSGVGLLLYLLLQWSYSFAQKRLKIATTKMKFLKWHKQTGYFAPLVFYVHSTATGYGYLLLLSIIYFTNFASALVFFNMLPKVKYITVYKAHIFFSCCILFLILFHLYVIIYYK